MNCSAKLSDFLITFFTHCSHHQPPHHRTIIFDAALITTSHSRDTLNGLYILHAHVVQRHILVTGPLLAHSLCTIFTFSFSTYFSRSIIVRRCVLTASNKRILYCIVHRPGHNATNTFTVALLPVITKTSQCMSKLQQATAVNFFLRNSV